MKPKSSSQQSSRPRRKAQPKPAFTDLENPQRAADYLARALQDSGTRSFLPALRNVTKARGGMLGLSAKVALSRASLYKILSKQGNPTFHTLTAILKALDLRIKIVPLK
jgi:probable addiction module antidote protein